MARYTLFGSKLFFLLVLFQAFSPIASAPMQYREETFRTSSSSGKSKYTFNLINSDKYQIPSPSFDAATGQLNFSVTGPPGEVTLYVRSTNVSWDNRTVYTNPFIGWIKKSVYVLRYGGWRRKVLWSVVIIIFPEALLFFALFERTAATRICTLIDKACGRHVDEKSNWTLKNLRKVYEVFLPSESVAPEKWAGRPQLGYCVLMGGFAIRNPQDELQTLTPDGVLFICRHLESAEKLARLVDDKNGASYLARCLVVFQVTWIIVEIICRYNAGLSVTLLETHTVIHAVCALMTYSVWFNKPFDINHPIELNFNVHDELIKKALAEATPGEGSGGACISLLTKAFSNKIGDHLKPLSEGSEPVLPRTGSAHLPLSTKRAGQTKSALRVFSEGEIESRRLSNLPNLILRIYQQLWILFWRECLFTSVAISVYGGLHFWALLAGHFPTQLEKTVWLAAVFAIASGGACWYFFLFVCKWIKLSGNRFWKWLFMSIWLVVLVVSTVARLYLVGESFASLRNPSASAFRMVSWTNLAIV
ncbi:hypothetical protein K440DRAFT_680812 [Wilcoxina mikolae CBS 423.85]|nr:hypothetical protein K440DRAFT_680812 [Wilcoxina mikolae CBS 423.85]